MAEVRPFNALRYTQKAGEISTLVCPPYDIINEEERQALRSKNSFNAINLELCKEGDNPYIQAKNNLNNWIEQGIIKCDDKPGLYIYEEEFTAKGKSYKIKGLVSLIRLEEFDKGVVIPHEETLAKAREDRFNLMRSTACDFSSIYCMYRDEDGSAFAYINELSNREPDQSFDMGDGIKHNLWFVYDEAQVDKLAEMFKDKSLYIADGHHRYTTMLNYRDELREKGVVTDSEHPANFGMITMMNIENPNLVVFPTHRVVRNLESFEVEKLLDGCGKYFLVHEISPEELESAVESCGPESEKPYLMCQDGTHFEFSYETAFGLYANNRAWLLVLRDDNIMKELLPEMSQAYRELDVAILHALILEKLLGIDKEKLSNQTNLIYTRDANEGIAMVDRGDANCLFIMNRTGVDEIAAVSDAKDKMPQKSTYFYPKLITGHVMYKIMDVK